MDSYTPPGSDIPSALPPLMFPEPWKGCSKWKHLDLDTQQSLIFSSTIAIDKLPMF